MGRYPKVASSVGNLDFRCVSISPHRFSFVVFVVYCYLLLYLLFCTVKRRPKLKSMHKERVETAIGYAQTIESWDDLVDPRTLAFYNLGPNPSPYVLRNIGIEGKKSKY